MNKFEKTFFEILINKHKFYIKSFTSSSYNKEIWVAISEGKNSIYAVIAADEKTGSTLYYEAEEYLRSVYDKPILLNALILTENYEGISYDDFNKLVFSIKERKVVYSSEGCKLLIPILEEIYHQEYVKKQTKKNSTLTNIIIAINIAAFLLSAYLSGNIVDIDTYTLVILGAKVNELINHGQIWRLITCAFLHGGLMHIVFNMYALKIMGSDLEYVYGKVKYLLIYFGSALTASIFSYVFGPNTVSVGASGAIFGMLGAMLVFGIKNRKRIGKGYAFNLLQVIVLNVLIGITMSNIDNSAHMGGFIAGAALAALLGERRKNNEIKR